ncbi:MAG: hypothetical protein J7M21_02640, partial [Planctomycetes bacterium]|nr:hypothetical protein [Planctomycetota bacterium]
MRWIPFVILVYVVVLLQATVGHILLLSPRGLGAVGPDVAALVAVFIAFYARSGTDAMLAAWALGLAVDLTTAGGLGSAKAPAGSPVTTRLLMTR